MLCVVQRVMLSSAVFSGAVFTNVCRVVRGVVSSTVLYLELSVCSVFRIFMCLVVSSAVCNGVFSVKSIVVCIAVYYVVSSAVHYV